jgi:hypothetical protein
MRTKFKCVVSYSPWTNAIFWLVVYFMSLITFMFSLILVYDAYTREFELTTTLYLLATSSVLLFLAWMVWRRGLFVKQDFVDLIATLGGLVSQESGVPQGRVDGVRIDAQFGRYLRDGAPFPSWHSPYVRKRPCGDPECMLCDSRFRISVKRGGISGGEGWRDIEEIIGGTWEGMKLRSRLEQAISDALRVAARQRA